MVTGFQLTSCDIFLVFCSKIYFQTFQAMVAHGRVELLAHPLSQKYLQMKWNSYGKYFHLANLLFYCIYLIFGTVYTYLLMTNVDPSTAAPSNRRLDKCGSPPVNISDDKNNTDEIKNRTSFNHGRHEIGKKLENRVPNMTSFWRFDNFCVVKLITISNP